MTEKQKRFIDEYLIDLNATAAASRAGYRDSGIGRQLMTKNNVLQEINKKISARSQRTQYSQDNVVNYLLEIKERCMQARPVVNTRGQQVQDEAGNNLWTFDAKNALRAIELLGKHMGMFKDKLQLENVGALKIQWKSEN